MTTPLLVSLFAVPFVLYSTRQQVLLIALPQIERPSTLQICDLVAIAPLLMLLPLPLRFSVAAAIAIEIQRDLVAIAPSFMLLVQ
ncbi:hypothetical protein ACSBR2_028978 [Camellia fascicularis]